MKTDSIPREEFYELSYYTLGHPDQVYFIHQHIVDAFQAQTVDKNTNPIGITFPLIGLYLFLEKGYTGRQVQLAHMKLAQHKKAWTMLDFPEERGAITVLDVLKAETGKARDAMIKEWCASVWFAFENWHEVIKSLAKTELGVG